MNERIKELAEEAQEYAEWSTPQGLEWFPTFKEKFARLIVQEVISLYNDDGHQTEYEQDMIVLKHFGME